MEAYFRDEGVKNVLILRGSIVEKPFAAHHMM